jgi:hypothetical protein
MKRSVSLLIGLTLLTSGCASGTGPGGIGALVGKRTLSSAEPLFGNASDKCFDSPGYLLGLLRPTLINGTSLAAPTQLCDKIIADLQVAMGAVVTTTSVDRAGTAKEIASFARTSSRKTEMSFKTTVQPLQGATHGNQSSYTESRRNEIIDVLLAESNRKCSAYAAFLKSYDSGANSSLSVLSILTGGLGAFVGGPNTAQALSGTSAIIAGTRSSLNEIHFTNQTIHVLTSAFEKTRRDQRKEIGHRQMCPVSAYSLMRGIEDTMTYHGSCSIIAGLAEAAKAVSRSENPGAEAMRTTLAEMTSLRRQADAFLDDGTPTQPSDVISRADESTLIAFQDAEKLRALELENARTALASADQRYEAEKMRDGSDDASLKPFADALTQSQNSVRDAVDAAARARMATNEQNVRIAMRRVAVSSVRESEETRDLSQISKCPFTADSSSTK